MMLVLVLSLGHQAQAVTTVDAVTFFANCPSDRPGIVVSEGGDVTIQHSVLTTDGSMRLGLPGPLVGNTTIEGNTLTAAAVAIRSGAMTEVTGNNFSGVIAARIEGDTGCVAEANIPNFPCGRVPQLINAALILDRLDIVYNRADGRAPAGVFTIKATFVPAHPDIDFMDVFFKVVTLTGGNVVLNADNGPGGVGVTVSRTTPVSHTQGFAFEVMFEIGLQSPQPFTFFVDVYGVLMNP